MSSSPPPLRLILASGSVYRRELLERLHLPFDVMVPSIDETARSGENAEATALRLCREKAAAIAQRTPYSLVIGCDQVATLDGQQIGKPGAFDKALQQLQTMRGREVIFHSALCLLDSRLPSSEPLALQIENIQTRVRFRTLPDQDLSNYLRIEQPYDCAGSAKNEGLGIALIEKIESSDPTALTGLPLIALTDMLRRAGVAFFTNPP